jgi:superfamily II DNA or RNA helicase
MEARPYQLRALESVRASYRSGHRAIVIVLPTGGGKTFLSTRLAEPVLRRGLKVDFVVHREELADQARRAFASIGFPEGDRFRVVSLQMAVARSLKLSPDLAIIDECHHTAADRWSVPIRAMRDTGVPLIGLTATPDRGDGRGLGEIFDDLVVGAQPRELIASGHLVPCRVLSPLRARASLADHPVHAYQEHAAGRRTVVFCSTVGHAQRLSEEFNAASIRSRCVEGNMDDAERARAIALFRAGEIDVLTNCQILTEGFDVPEVACVITTTGASAPAPLIQKVGRGMRPAPGKVDCVHLDLRGAWRDVGMLPDDDRSFSLEGRAIKAHVEGELLSIVQCRGCGLWFRASEFRDSACPECGMVRKGREDPQVRRARLAVIADREMTTERISFLARKVREGRSKRKADGTPYKAMGWALQQYRVKYRQWPNEGQINAARRIADQA